MASATLHSSGDIDRMCEMRAWHRITALWGVSVLEDRHGRPWWSLSNGPGRIVGVAQFLNHCGKERQKCLGVQMAAATLCAGMEEAVRCHVPLIVVVEFASGLFRWEYSRNQPVVLECRKPAYEKPPRKQWETVVSIPAACFRRVVKSNRPHADREL